ncbi:MAG: germination protein YpeB [Clostridia bacterium]|nr:germination protein YpeB [Clostridia bacterium]
MKKIAVSLIVLILVSSIWITHNYHFQNTYAFLCNSQLVSQNIISQIERKEITVEEAREKIERRFSRYGIKSIEHLKEEAGSPNVYNFKIVFANDKELCIQVTKIGGYILNICCFTPRLSGVVEEQECLQMVEEFVHDLGFTDLKAIWYSYVGDQMAINLAPVIKDVIVYPYLMKARVNCKTGEITHLEARSYLYDYYPKGEEEIEEPIITYEEALSKLDERFTPISYKKVLLFDDIGKDRLAYEIKSKLGEFIYYFYVDAITGELIKAFPVVD